MEIAADNLACVRGGRAVFDGISFRVAAGEALLLTGANGAGKTSLLRILAGFIPPASGTLRFSAAAEAPGLPRQCHYVGHANAVKTALSVEENLSFWTRFSGGVPRDDALQAFDLAPYASFPAALLSAGQRRRLALSRLAAVTRPVWLLDEPTVGLDTDSTKALCDLMRPHLRQGGIIIASSHVEIGIEFSHELRLPGRGHA